VNAQSIEIIEMDRYLADGEKYFLEYNHLEIFYQPHLHRFIEIELITDGSGYEEIDGKVYEIQKGDITVMLPDEVHSFVSKTGEALKITSVKVSPHFLTDSITSLHTSLLIKSLPEDEYILICQLCQKLNMIQKEKHGQGMEILARECIQLILLLCLTHKNDEMPLPVETTEQDRFRRALLYIHKNFRRNLTVAEVAEEVYLVPNYFSSYFEKNMGMSCRRYINKLRMDLAYEYIMDTDISLKEIVYRCGFHSFSYFSNVFKAHYGCSPGACRKNKSADRHSPSEN